MIRLIAAIDRKRGIAKQGFQPWYIPADSRYFVNQTKTFGGSVLIGSTTYKMLSGPLKDRTTYVLTREKAPIQGVELIHNLGKFLDDWQTKDLWVVGGANVFTQVMDPVRADELYLTTIEADFGCNQFFPSFEEDFILKEQSPLHEQNGFIYTFTKYVRKLKK